MNEGSGIGYDYLEPDGSPQYIAPGQPRTLKYPMVDPRAVSVKVEVIAVIYLDQTAEGVGGAVSGMFDFRLSQAKEIRKSLAEEPHSPAEQERLEKRAAFYESAAIPQEAK